jgi:TolA-binding protein
LSFHAGQRVPTTVPTRRQGRAFEPAATPKQEDGERLHARRARLGARRQARRRAARSRPRSGPASAGGKRKKNLPSRDEIEARHARALIAEKQGATDIATTELRWLATFAPAADFASDVDARLERLAPKRVLTKRERYGVRSRWHNAGRSSWWSADARHQDHLGRGGAEASELLTEASRAGGENAAHDLFHAARAFSRAHKDDQAIAVYGEVARRFKSSAFAEQARFLSARLLYVGGRWKEAATAYTAYTRRHAKEGRFASRSTTSRPSPGWRQGSTERNRQDPGSARRSETRATSAPACKADRRGAGSCGQGGHQDVRARNRGALVASRAGRRHSPRQPRAPVAPIEPPSGRCGQTGRRAAGKVRLLHSLGFDSDAEQVIEGHEAVRQSTRRAARGALPRSRSELGPARRAPAWGSALLAHGSQPRPGARHAGCGTACAEAVRGWCGARRSSGVAQRPLVP